MQAVPSTFNKFGNYILLKKLATGGMAEVFLARPGMIAGNGRVQVIKRILPHIANDPEFLKMFRSEAQVIMGFNHPHIVQLHDFGIVEGQSYIAMEYIEGKSLKEIANKFKELNETMPLSMAIGLIAQAAAGLSYAHSFVNKVTGEAVNAVHRDVSPQNLIVSYDGNLKVIDFGIAKAQVCPDQQTRSGIIKGKLNYLSPEQAAGGELDLRTDIFALGLVAWELVTFSRPFGGGNDAKTALIRKIRNCDQVIAPPSSHVKNIPPAVDRLIMKALEKDPEKRYSSGIEFQKAAREILRTHYPTYSYSDTAEIMKTLFEKEIEEEETEIRELNDQAQQALLPPTELRPVEFNRTVMLPPQLSGRRNFSTTQSWTHSWKQKASLSHFAMAALFMFGIFTIKLDQRYSFLDRVLFPQSPTQNTKRFRMAQMVAPPRQPSQRASERKPVSVTVRPSQLKAAQSKKRGL